MAHRSTRTDPWMALDNTRRHVATAVRRSKIRYVKILHRRACCSRWLPPSTGRRQRFVLGGCAHLLRLSRRDRRV